MIDATAKKRPSARNINQKYNWVGMVPDIVEFLAKTLNFTYDLGFPRDGSWGAFDDDTGEWSGIIGDILDGDVDVGFAPLTVLHERAEAVDFLIPIHSDKSTFVVSQELSFNNSYTTTFNSDLWTMIAVFAIILSLALSLMIKIGKDQQSSAFLLEQCFIYSSGALCGFKAKGWYTTPVSVSARSGILTFLHGLSSAIAGSSSSPSSSVAS